MEAVLCILLVILHGRPLLAINGGVFLTQNTFVLSEGKPITFTCNASCVASGSLIKWFLGSHLLNNTGEVRSEINSGNPSCSDTVGIISLTPRTDPTGLVVTCEAVDANSHETYNSSLIIRGLDEAVFLSQNTSVIMEGQPVMFTCNVSCLPSPSTIQWHLSGVQQQVDQVENILQNGCHTTIGTFVITPEKSQSGLQIACLVINNNIYESLRSNTTLVVHGGPTETSMCVWDSHSCDPCMTCARNATEGDTLDLQCTAVGSNPVSHLTWEVKGQQTGDTLEVLSHTDYTELYDNVAWTWDVVSKATVTIPGEESHIDITCGVWYPDNITMFREEHLLVLVQPEGTHVVSIWMLLTIFTASVASFVLVVSLCCFAVKRKSGQRERGKPRAEREGDVTLPMVGLNKQKDLEVDTPVAGDLSAQASLSADQTRVLNFEFPRDKVKLQRVLGDGFYGQVYEAVAEGILHDGEYTTVAVKIMKGHSSISDFKNELAIFKALRKHPFVVSFLGSCTEKEPFYLIMECVSFGTLEGYIRKKRLAWDESRLAYRSMKEAINPLRILNFAYQIADGMEYLSSMHLIHRDLATRNVLLGEGLTCKLCDFGLARDVTGTEQYKQSSVGAVPFRWLALECLLHSIYTAKSDVWSFGVLLWELVTLGAQPYANTSFEVIILHLQSGFRLPMPVHCGKELYEMMSSCWCVKPESRPNFTELRKRLDYLLKSDSEMLNMSRFATDHYVYQNPMTPSVC